MNLVAILIVLSAAWFWSTKGFFSAFLQAVITVVAGAVAFGLWEPVSWAIIGIAPDRGFLAVLENVAWAAGLLVPFALTVVLLRLIADQAVKANVKMSSTADYVGGGLMGLIVGMVTTGILVIGMGFARGEARLLGYSPVAYSETGDGSLVRTGGLWIKADALTEAFYGQLSRTSLHTGTPLAELYPSLHTAGYAINTSFGDGRVRSVMPRDGVDLLGSYVVGDPQRPMPREELMRARDENGDVFSQRYLALDGQSPAEGAVHGYVLGFDSSAGDNGQLIFGNGQFRLIAERSGLPGETVAIHPFSMVSQGNTEGRFGRWRFEGAEVFIASVGAAARPTMSFEFFVPAGLEPRYLTIKNTRLDLREQEAAAEPVVFAAAAERDRSVGSGRIFDRAGGTQEIDWNTRFATSFSPDGRGGTVAVTTQLGFNFQNRQAGGLSLTDEDNLIIAGTQRFNREDINNATGRDAQALRVDSFASREGTNLVQVDVSFGTEASATGRPFREAGVNAPPQLEDTNGTVYPCVGYVYEEGDLITVSYTPGSSLRGMGDLPETITSSRTDQRLVLLFQVSENVEIRRFGVGEFVVLDIRPPLEVGRQRRR